MSKSEKTPLLEEKPPGLPRRSSSLKSSLALSLMQSLENRSKIGLQRHITLLDCIGIIVGNVIGSGIFISPKGVVENIGSVGATLIVWVVMGFCALAQALCYAELGAAIPLSGGDYAYVYAILGPLPAFMCVWTQVAIAAPSTNAVISRTAGIYLAEIFGLGCSDITILMIAFWILITFAAVNSYSSRLGTKVQVIFSVAKVATLAFIGIIGIVFLCKGYTSNFSSDTIFEGTTTNPGLIGLAGLNGYFAYKGWEQVNTLPEEMVNPTRDLHISVWVALSLVTGIYTLTNVAYFTMMSPAQILSSEAVALTFTDLTLGPAMGYVISVSVALTCMGTINGSFLADTRYLFAAGRNKQFPELFSMIHTDQFTPVPAMIVLCLASMCYALIPNVEMLTSYTSLAVQLKILLSFIALFYLRWKAPDLERPVKTNIVLAVATFFFMIIMIVLSMSVDPETIGIGIAIFFLSIPVYFLLIVIRRLKFVNSFMDSLTVFTQSFLFIAPETEHTEVAIKSS